MIAKAFAVLVAISVLSACHTRSTLSSISISERPALDLDKPSGPVYFLPITILEIEGAPCLKSEVKDGSAPPAAAKESTPPATAVNVVNNIGDKPPASPAEPGAAEKPKPCKADDPTADYGIRVTSRTIADTSKGYQVAFPLANVSSNKPVVKVDSNGLLSSANTVSKDETREAVVSFGESFGMLAGVGLLGSSPKFYAFETTIELADSIPKSENFQKPKPKVHKFCVVKKLGGVVQCVSASAADDASGSLSVSLVTASTSASTTSADTTSAGTTNTVTCKSEKKGWKKADTTDCAPAALIFRTRIGVLSVIEIGDTDGAFAKTTALLPMIDPARDYAVTAVARPFVQSETKLTFDKGVLTGFEGDYPSTGGAAFSLPADFLGSVFSGLANAISLRGNVATSEADLLKAETELLKAQIELETARREAGE